MATISQNNSRLRVAHVALQLDTGGLEKLLVEFARHADRSRFDLRFVSVTDRGLLSDEIEACNWPVTAMNEPPGLRPGMVMRFAKLFRKWNIDVVHTHNFKPQFYAGPGARLAKVPVVLNTSHGQRHGSSLRHTMMYVMASCSADRVVGVSRDIALRRAKEGISEGKIRTIWNGIDFSRFAYHGPQAGGPVVLVARLRPEKDIETMLRATALIVHRHPSFQLEIAGEGDLGPALKELANDLKITKNVRFLGNVRDIPGLLERASLFVLSSLSEGIPVALLEAMACGLPPVVTCVGGNAEVILNGETGFLVPPGDPTKLAAAIEQVWTDPDLGFRLGLAARKRIEQHFDVKSMVAQYEALYEELASRRRPQPHLHLAGEAT